MVDAAGEEPPSCAREHAVVAGGPVRPRCQVPGRRLVQRANLYGPLCLSTCRVRCGGPDVCVCGVWLVDVCLYVLWARLATDWRA